MAHRAAVKVGIVEPTKEDELLDALHATIEAAKDAAALADKGGVPTKEKFKQGELK